MHLGITGSRHGLCPAQRIVLTAWLEVNTEFDSNLYHGACVGVDEQVVEIFKGLVGDAIIQAFPGNIPSLTSQRAIELSHVVYDPDDCLRRNRRIVDSCAFMVACPDGPERLRSGTWATIRYARKVGRPLVVIYPDGSQE